MSRARSRPKGALVLGGLLFIQLVLLSLQVPLGDRPSVFEKAVFAAFAPLQRSVRAVRRGVLNVWNRYVFLRGVEAANRSLQDEVVRLREENTLLRNGLAGLEDRAAAEGVLRSLGRAFRLGSVIGVDMGNPYKSVVIDAGAAEGIRPDMPVLDKWGRLVGKVVAPVSAGEAVVQLVTDENSGVAVATVTSRIMGVLAGDGANGRCRLKYVPATNETVKEGEELVTSGLDDVFPAGLPVGIVASVGSDILFKRISVSPYLDFRDLRLVAVLLEVRGRGD
jgi:rod shape-determining protein MreC